MKPKTIYPTNRVGVGDQPGLGAGHSERAKSVRIERQRSSSRQKQKRNSHRRGVSGRQ